MEEGEGGRRRAWRAAGRRAGAGKREPPASLPASPTGPTTFPVYTLGRWVLRETAHVRGGRAGIEATGLNSTSALSTRPCARRCAGQPQASAGHRQGTCHGPHSRVSIGMINARPHLTFTTTQRTRDFHTHFINESLGSN